MIILLQLISSLERVILDYGKGKNRKSIKLSDVILPDIDKSCLIGFHAFTGNVGKQWKKSQTVKVLLEN